MTMFIPAGKTCLIVATMVASLGCREKGMTSHRVPADFQAIGAALKVYAINAGRPPTTEQGQEALVARPTLEPLPEDWVQVAEKVPTDPWKQPYHYRELPEKEGSLLFEIRSMGSDGKLWTDDDRYQAFDWKRP